VGIRLMYMGDSIIWGYPPGGFVRRTTCYNRLVAAGWEVDFVGRIFDGNITGLPQYDGPPNEGWSGDRIDELDARLEAALVANPADLVFFQAGTNDARALQDPQAHLTTYLNHLAALSWQTRVIVSTIPPLDPAVGPPNVPVGSPAIASAFNTALPGVVTTQQGLGQHVHYADVGGTLTLADLYSDGIHPAGDAQYIALGNLDADAILALYVVTAPSLPGRVQTRVGIAGVDTYRVIVEPIGSNIVKSVRFGERINLEGVLSLQLDFTMYASGSLSFTVQRISPVTDASLELTITDSVGDWTTTVAMAAGPS
jgi:lysophospholipase L1-like esterase